MSKKSRIIVGCTAFIVILGILAAFFLPFGKQEPPKAVKNVIFMIADGGGYDNFTLADKVKQEMVADGTQKLSGAKTEITTDLLADLGIPSVDGLYLNALLVGSANTLLLTPHGDEDEYTSYITDSSAAGTALSSGYKTTYCYAGVDSEGNPRASLVELARMNGMSTGVVTTKSYIDATPLAFMTGHSIHRNQYQDTSLQALLSGIDVVIGEGTEYGDVCKEGEVTSHPDISASTMGYTVAKTKQELLSAAGNSDTKKLWAPIVGVDNKTKELKETAYGATSDHISYDVDAALSAEQPSLLDMTKAALTVLGSNIDNPEGFFLMIEGGALDNAAEQGYLRPAIGEYLAFDEAFGYCVNWAAQRGDTMVIAVPDHDSGGFTGIKSCEDVLIDSIISGRIGDAEFHNRLDFGEIIEALNSIGADTKQMMLHGGHTDMPVPISLYAPDSVKETLLTNMTLPTTAGDVRLGTDEYYVGNYSKSLTWYSSYAINEDYLIDNTAIAPAIAKTLQLGSMEEATRMLFHKIGHTQNLTEFTGDYGGSMIFVDSFQNGSVVYVQFAYENKDAGLWIDRDTATYTYKGTEHTNPKIGNLQPLSLMILDNYQYAGNGTLYVPYNILADTELGWSVTIAGSEYAFDRVLAAGRHQDIVLPESPDGRQISYTDGTQTYKPGDVLKYTGENIKLTANIE